MGFIDNILKIINAFHGDLQRLAASIEDQTKAAKNASAAPQNNHIPQPFSIIVPEGIENRKSSSDKRSDIDYQNKSLFWQRWTFVALVVYALFTLLIYYATKKSADAAKDAAKAAHDSVTLARKSAHFDQRAWLGIDYGIYKFTVNQPFSATYEITDTGKTPAKNARGLAVTHFFYNTDEPVLDFNHGTSVDAGTILQKGKAPADSWLIDVGIPKESKIKPIKLSQRMVNAINDHTGYVMIYGEIEYDSVFGAHHWIKFCASTRSTDVPKECIHYNDVDTNEEP